MIDISQNDKGLNSFYGGEIHNLAYRRRLSEGTTLSRIVRKVMVSRTLCVDKCYKNCVIDMFTYKYTTSKTKV